MMMRRILAFLQKHVIGAMVSTGLLSGIGTAILSDFASWRTSNREFLKAQTEASQHADQDMIDILRKFSNKALGRGDTSEDDLRQLKQNVSRSYLVASTLSDRAPALKDGFTKYANALVSVQKSAEMLNGPADAKAFVEAVSDYADKREAFSPSYS